MNTPDNKISADEVRKVAGLAMLNLSEEEVETYTPQLASILELAEQMDSFDIENYEPTAHPHGLVNVYREDEVEEVDVTVAALNNAPQVEANQFMVPPVLGEEL